MNAAASGPLAERGIVVTRPAHQSAALAALIRAAGGTPIMFPVIEIAALEDRRLLDAAIDRLDDYAVAIFVSPNAVIHAMTAIAARRALPPHLQLAAIGEGGTRELQSRGAVRVLRPSRFDSEALLELPELQRVAGTRIAIFRGDGGRELLGDALAARGAAVEYVECYRRRRPQSGAAPLHTAWASGRLHAITVTSSAGAQNLIDLVGAEHRPRLLGTPLFVPHRRIAQSARALRFERVIATAQGDAGLVQGMALWFSGRA